MATTSGMGQLVDELERNFRETQERMSDPAVYNDRREAAVVGRRLKELEAPHRLAERWRSAVTDLEAARADAELAEMVPEYESEIAHLEEELKLALVEKDPADEKDVIVEVRQGVGGDEAALWAADVARMLQRYAERRGFKTETLSTSESEAGGIKETVFAVKGDGAYSVFKWEGGTHRVQRVPTTESQGRIHTSTATVAVMPEAEEVEVAIDENDQRPQRHVLCKRQRERQPALIHVDPSPHCVERDSEHRAVRRMHHEAERTPSPAEELDVRVVAAEDTPVERLLQPPDDCGDGSRCRGTNATRHTLAACPKGTRSTVPPAACKCSSDSSSRSRRRIHAPL